MFIIVKHGERGGGREGERGEGEREREEGGRESREGERWRGRMRGWEGERGLLEGGALRPQANLFYIDVHLPDHQVAINAIRLEGRRHCYTTICMWLFAIGGPVAVRGFTTFLCQRTQHDNEPALELPHHPQ